MTSPTAAALPVWIWKCTMRTPAKQVVQAYAGGIRLDTIFIDEGFGSLDSEALDDAMRALIDLQKSGRLVAIISHVAELKERIDVRLEVSSGQTGSTAQFTLN
jgi:exonuclease SbcC